MREQNHARPRSRRRRLLALEPTRARRPSAASPSRTSKATTKSSASRLKALVQGQPSPGSSPARPGAARKTLNRLRLHPLPCCTAFLRSSHTRKPPPRRRALTRTEPHPLRHRPQPSIRSRRRRARPLCNHHTPTSRTRKRAPQQATTPSHLDACSDRKAVRSAARASLAHRPWASLARRGHER